MKKHSLALLLSLILVCTLVVASIHADDSVNPDNLNDESSEEETISSFEWENYSLDDLKTIREQLDNYIYQLERQYAIENGNRIIHINENEAVIFNGKTLKLSAEVERVVDDAPEATKVSWTSSDESIAKVSSEGIVTGQGFGDAIITCTAKDDDMIFSEVTVHVVLPVSSVKLNTESASLLITERNAELSNIQLECSIEPADAYCQDVIWSSSDESVATVDNEGNVHAVSAGSAKITAMSCEDTSSPKKAVCSVKVTQGVNELELNSTDITIDAKGKETLQVNVIPDNATDKKVLWESSNPEVATVSSSGTVTGVSNGKATITCIPADGSDVSVSCNVTVIQMISDIKFKKDANTTLGIGGTLQLAPEVSPSNVTNGKLFWSSSDPEIASVDDDGVVTANKAGVVRITCSSTDGSNKSAYVELFIGSLNAESITHTVTDKEGYDFEIGYYGDIKDLEFKNASYFDSSYSLEEENILKIHIDAIKAGTGTLEIRDKSDSRNILKLNIIIEHSACYDSTSYPKGSYDAIMRNPYGYDDVPMYIYGRVLQKQDSFFSTVMRVATSGRYDDVFYVTCSSYVAAGIIEGDYIYIYGTCDGTETYTTVLGGQITIPSLDAEKIILAKK